MKKTLKLVLIFIGSLTAIIVGATTGYILINKNKTFYIYDVRLVEPVEGMKGYIYTDEDVEYTSIKNQTLFMSSKDKNLYPIAVYVNATTSANDVKITSSDTSIVKITSPEAGKCYFELLKEGTVTITSEFYGVKDSVIIKVLDPMPSDVSVYDYDYYGKYAELFPNEVVAYADSQEYRYKYSLGDLGTEVIDGDLVKIDLSRLDKTVFEDVYIDSANSELVIKCNKQEENISNYIDHSVIFMQSYYHSDDGEIVLKDTYDISVDIVLYEPEFLQIEISGSPNFEEKFVYTKTEKVDISSLTDEEIKEDKTRLDMYLKTEKAENNLAKNGEKSTNVAYFTNVIDTLYLRFRMVYTNGHIEYLTNGDNANIEFSQQSLCKLDPTGDYYILKLDTTNYFSGGTISYNITLNINGFSFTSDEKLFEFKYVTQENENVDLFYTKDSDGYYTYSYWDDRTRFDNEIYESGKIIGFGE